MERVGQAVGGRHEVWVPKAKIPPAIKLADGLGSLEGVMWDWVALN